MHAIPFNIFTNAKYHHVKVVNYKVVFWSLTIGSGKFIKKLDVLSIEDVLPTSFIDSNVSLK